MADCYALLGSYGALSPQDAFQKSRSSALKALEIDTTLADAHSSLAFAQGFYEWDWRGSERRFRRAIDLSQSYPTFHWYGYLLMALGRLDEAFVNIRNALDLDPLALVINAQLAWALQFARRYDDAIEQARKTLEMDPAFGLAQLWMGLKVISTRVATKWRSPPYRRPTRTSIWPRSFLEFLAMPMPSPRARRKRNRLSCSWPWMRSATTSRPSPKRWSTSGWEIFDQAFAWFEKALEDRSWWLAWLKVDPLFDRARSDPRFPSLMSCEWSLS